MKFNYTPRRKSNDSDEQAKKKNGEDSPDSGRSGKKENATKEEANESVETLAVDLSKMAATPEEKEVKHIPFFCDLS